MDEGAVGETAPSLLAIAECEILLIQSVEPRRIMNLTNLHHWLTPLDSVPLECDGLTRAISILLQRERISHHVCIGALYVHDVGRVDPHWWIQLSDGSVCDFRARMWLGNEHSVPHGVFHPEPQHQYRACQITEIEVSDWVFEILTLRPLDSYPRFESCST